ncbi:BTAD domain-containing putative transcriptional regulator [Actinomycetospora sp. TBRC 11914]|uniref:BTAD domain-containing putative transcriptional regulator n=1 Tax=Actinomycetospora sp. TBRC 11914 TaxID=2729387 RepID=UPI00145DD0B0|nr:BTAD domain-containing putative transcriptional regulator [Actinomycetospora sp. TBRC 11914]NMO89396.1 transcriptional activator domain protein [Actinomycetospora sp. TBRC 11914]
MDSPEWVIQRKIVPPRPDTTATPRPRVSALLARLLEAHRLVFVYASAGAGKTTAVLHAAAQIGRPLAWLDLDTTDVATGRLLVYLEAALARQVPTVRGIASGALAANLAHPEVAGLLAEAVGDSEVMVVVDDAERLADSPAALAVLGAFARYLPESARLVLLSRVELRFSTVLDTSPWVAAVGEEDLALTVGEATAALARTGRTDVDPVEALIETGGWLTGVLFEAWRSQDHVIGLGGEADPLHGYLSTQILGQLDEADREFLVTTAVLEEVTAAHAEALGLAAASSRLHALRGRRLPVSWDGAGTRLRCHPRFREFLLRRLAWRGEDELRRLRRAHAELLLAAGHDEEAVEELLAAQCLERAVAVVSPVLERLIERTDFRLAERWLARLDPVRREHHGELAGAELMLAVVREDFAAGVRLADRLAASGHRDELAKSSGRAAALMAWCYLHAGRPADMQAVIESAVPGPDVDAARYAMRLVDTERSSSDEVDPSLGALTGGPMDALVMRAHFDLGRLGDMGSRPASPWAVRAAESWRVSGLLATGRTAEAFELYHRLVDTGAGGSGEHSVWLEGLVGPRLMAEIGEPDAAWRLLREGRARIAATGSALFEVYSRGIEVELELRLHDDPAAARRALHQVAEHPIGRGYALVAEHVEMLRGRIALAEREPAAAAVRLRRAVAGMRHGGRLLYLPAAAVYLAEAAWRSGDEDGADAAADVALAAARGQGSVHGLLSALAEFPDVLARRLDLEVDADSPWHELGRALRTRVEGLDDLIGSAVHVAEFGRTAITLDGREVKPRLAKSVELLAHLATRGDAEAVGRPELLGALFEGRRDESATSYLRQAILHLRKVLPDVVGTVDGSPGALRLCPGVRVTTESRRVVALVAQATTRRGEERLRLLLDALELVDRGPYLPGLRSAWVEERRLQLAEITKDVRFEAAEAAFATGGLRRAEELLDEVLRADPAREAGWRLRMRLAHAHGDPDRVLAAYRSCERALGELGAQPSATTVALLRDLRR